MASYRKREAADGHIYYEVRVSRGRGRSYISRVWHPPVNWSAKSIERELARVAADLERQVADGEVMSRQEEREREAAEAAKAAELKTVQQYADGVFLPTKKLSMSINGIESYTAFLEKHIYPALGGVVMAEVTPAMLKKVLLDFQAAGYSHATTIKLYNVLNGVFDMAFMDDTISVNPMLKVKRPAMSKDTIKMKDNSEKALTAGQLAALLAFMETEPLKWRVFVNLCVDTGCRRGELVALQWDDIDADNHTVIIRRNAQYSPQKGAYCTSPKNGKPRKIDIGDETLEMLHQLHLEQAQSLIFSNWIFTRESSAEMMHPQTPTRYFHKLGDRCGIENLHPHLLRHSFASVALTSGADVVSVSERLGHSDTAVTLRMYAHANDESVRRAGQTARDAVKAARET